MKSSTKVISKVEAEKRIMALVRFLKKYVTQNRSCGLEMLPAVELSRDKLVLLGHALAEIASLGKKAKLKATEEFYGLVRATLWSPRIRFNALIKRAEEMFNEFKEMRTIKLSDFVDQKGVEKLTELMQGFLESLAFLKK